MNLLYIVTIFFTISLFIFICLNILKNNKSKESFDNSKYNTEIHFITFWTNDYNSKQRVMILILELLKNLKLKKKTLKAYSKMFKVEEKIIKIM